jgi:hypothetical protein
LSFYGDLASENISRFSLLLASEKSKELQESLGISVHHISNIIDVKTLAGEQYKNRLDASIIVHYNTVADVETLRIDTAQTQLITN